MTRLLLFASGAAGFWILGRVLSDGAAVSPLGSDWGRLLLALMALLLAAGLLELWVRLRAGERESRGLAELAARSEERGTPATQEELASLEPRLADRIRARLERHPVVSPHTGFSVYFAGLLAVLGLLAGVLGLIGLLTGAEEAMVASRTWSGLRTGLTDPMLVLADGFETTLAGLASAALLGIAALGVRRREIELAAEADAFAAGPLAPPSTLGAQLRALQALAVQGEALPLAAQRLGEVSARLSQLETSWCEAHEKSTRDNLVIVRDALVDFRTGVKGAVEEAARVATEAVAPLFEAAVERTVGASRAQVERLLQQLEAGAERDAARAGGLVELVESAATRLSESAAATGELASRQREADAKMQQSLREEAAELSAGLGRLASELRTAAAEQAAALTGLAETVRQGQAGAEAEAEARAEALHAAMREGFERHAEGLALELRAAGEFVEQAAGVVQAGGLEMSSVAEMFAAAVDRQQEAAREWLTSLGAIEGAVERAGQGAAAEALREQLGSTQALFARQLQFQQELFEQLRALRSEEPPPVGDVREEERELESALG